MKQLLTLLLLFTIYFGFSQNDNPYAKFGYKGNTIKTPQEKMDYMLIIQNQDSLSIVQKIGIEPKDGQYYFFDKENNIVFQDTLRRQQITRFFSVDPLTKDYPHNAPYAFSENRVLDAIELEGLEAFFIHGTMSNNKRWRDENGKTREATKQLLRITPNKWFNTGFEWGSDVLNYGNGPFNDKSDRNKAANALVDYIMANRIDDEDITLLGHSHGGNIALQAVPLLKSALERTNLNDIKINVVTIATPAVNNIGDSENPATHTGILSNHIQIYNKIDIIQKTGANAFNNKLITSPYSRTYNNPSTKNVEIDVSEFYKTTGIIYKNGQRYEYTKTDGIGAHSADFEHPEIIKKNIDNGTIKPIEN